MTPRQQIGLSNLPIGSPSHTTQWSVVSENLAVIGIYIAYLIMDVIWCLYHNALTLFPKITLFCLSAKKSPLHSWKWHDRNSSRSKLGEHFISRFSKCTFSPVCLTLVAAVKCYFIHNEHYKYKYKTSVSLHINNAGVVIININIQQISVALLSFQFI